MVAVKIVVQLLYLYFLLDKLYLFIGKHVIKLFDLFSSKLLFIQIFVLLAPCIILFLMFNFISSLDFWHIMLTEAKHFKL